jgi:sugar lactone lactonase YvrE
MSGYNTDIPAIPASSALLNSPFGMIVNPVNGNIYIADTCNFRVRMIDVSNGTITTVAGNGTQGYNPASENGPGVQAQLANPRQLAIDSSGNLYIADWGNHDDRCGNSNGIPGRIWKLSTNGTIQTFNSNYSRGVAVANIGGSDNVFVASSWQMARFFADGTGILVAGGGTVINGPTYSGFSGDGGEANAALINTDGGIAVNATTGEVYVADQVDNVVRKLTPAPAGKTLIHAFPFGIRMYGGGTPTSTSSVAFDIPPGVNTWNATSNMTTTSNGVNWLSISPISGSASYASFGAVTITATVTGMASGSYNGSVTITNTDSVNSITVPVTLTIQPPAVVTNPVNLSQFGSVGGFVGSQNLAVFNGGLFNSGSTINFTAAAVATAPQWLSVSPTTQTSTGNSLNAANLTVSYNTAGLAAGTYTGGITLSSGDVVNSPVTVPVTLTLSAPPAPALSTINPGNGAQGQAVSVTLAGSNFLTAAPTISAGSGITVSSINVLNDRTMTATFTIDSAAGTLGNHNVTITTAGGTSGALVFAVLGPPTLASLNPIAGPTGSTVNVTLTGTNFVIGATTVSIAGTGVTVNVTNPTNTSTTARVAAFTIAPDATPGARAVTVSTAAGTSGSVNFTVTSEAAYIISRFAGLDVLTVGGTATNQPLPAPSDVARDSIGNLYIASQLANKVFKITTGGVISTFAGTGTIGNGGDGGPAVSAQLNSPRAVIVDPNDNVLIADTGNQRIRKVSNGTISTFAGTGSSGFGGDGGAATFAILSNPTGLGIDPAGNVYISDSNNRRIRKVSTAGIITTVAGNGINGFYGDNGPAVLAQLNLDTGSGTKLAIDGNGNIYIPDTFNHRIRRVDSNGTISTFAGIGINGFNGDGSALLVNLSSPRGVSLDPVSGGIFIADSGNNRIRKLVNGVIATVAGNGGNGFNGDGSPATAFQLTGPTGTWTDAAGTLYFADVSSNRVRQLSGTTLSTLAGITGHNVYTGALPGDGGLATASQLYAPNAVAIDPLTGNLLIADTREYRLRQVDSSGNITTIAGTGSSSVNGDGAAAASAAIGFVQDMVTDSAGNVYLAGNNRVRKISRGPGNTFGNITTIAGNGSANFSGDGVPGGATAAGTGELNNPAGLAIDNSGNVYIADSNNQRIRMLTVATSTLSTVAGNGSSGNLNINGPATLAQLNFPRKLAFISDASIYGQGNLYIADANNNRIVVLTNQNLNLFSTFGGSAVAYSAGSLYISSPGLIQRAFPDGTSSTIAGNGFGISGDGGAALMAAANAFSLAPAADGSIYFADNSDNVVRKLTPVSPGTGVLSVAPAGINVRLGNNSTNTQTITIALTGSGTFTWTATSSIAGPMGSEWLSLSAASGTGGFPLIANINASGLAPGIYNGSVTVTSTTPINSAVTVPVTLTVLPNAILANPVSLSATAVAGAGSNPASSLLSVSNGGSGPSFGFSVTSAVITPIGGNWLTVTGGSFTTPSSNFSVNYNIAGLAPGIYTGAITITAASVTNSPVTVPVTLTITPNGAPTLTSIFPASGNPGQLVPITLTGTNFFPGTTTLSVPVGTGLSLSNTTFINGTTIYAILSIANNATLTSNNISVNTPNGSTGVVAFTVTAVNKRRGQITSQ